MINLLSEINANKRFRDPIYGYIWLTEDEVSIVDTCIFQRLRRIQQLALTKYVYQTAEHSRFVHSLGVLQSATNIFLEILRKKENCDILFELIKDEELVDYFKTLRFAALLHDIGHFPFSHACEDILLPAGIKHEDISQFIIVNYSAIQEKLERNSISSKLVASLLRHQSIVKYSLINAIISGIFDADRADYLLRDSYNCGVSYGNYDYMRYVSSFSLSSSGGKNFTLAVDEGSIHTLEAFLLARYHYKMQVTHHRTRIGYDLSLKKYISFLADNKKLPIIVKTNNKKVTEVDFQRLEFFDDSEIFQYIKEDCKKGNPWAKILMREGHLKPVYDSLDLDKESELNYADYILRLKDSGLKEHSDFIKYSEKIEIHDFIDESKEKDEKKNIINVIDKRRQVLGDFVKLSPLIQRLGENPVRILRVYVAQDQFDNAKRIKQELNEHIEKRNLLTN